MKTIELLFENNCNRKIFMSEINSLLKSYKINGRYLSLYVKLNNKNIGDHFIVDRLNHKSISYCKFYFNRIYTEDILDNELEIESIQILFDVVDINLFQNFIKNFYRNTN